MKAMNEIFPQAGQQNSSSSNLTTATIDDSKSCDTLREKIQYLLDSKQLTKAAFTRDLGVSAHSLNHFLSLNGPTSGMQSNTYSRSLLFLAGYELCLKVQEEKNESRKRTASDLTTTDNTTAAQEPPQKVAKVDDYHRTTSSRASTSTLARETDMLNYRLTELELDGINKFKLSGDN